MNKKKNFLTYIINIQTNIKIISATDKMLFFKKINIIFTATVHEVGREGLSKGVIRAES